jgi:predicted protein tyrosine phosphatase
MPIQQIAICGIDELPMHAGLGATRILSFLDPDLLEIDVFDGFGQHEREIFRFHDIIAPEPGYVLPTMGDMQRILDIGQKLMADEAKHHLLVHCHQGVSRSTAVVTSLLAQAHPELEEDLLFARLREYRMKAWPNSLMIQYADELLGKEGRLLEALARHYAYQIKRRPAYERLMNSLGRQKEVQMAYIS